MNSAQSFDKSMLFKWLASIVLPLASYFLLLGASTLSSAQAAFVAVTLWAVCAWVMNTISDTVVGIMLPGLYILFCDGVDFAVVYGPWRGEIWILAVGGFVLGAIIEQTGLGRRIAMASVRAMGGSLAGALAGFTLGAIIISPLVPSIMGKTAIFLGVVVSLCDALGLKKGSREATIIALGTITAVASTKLAWLTGAGDVIMGMGILESVTGNHISWMQYAIYNAPPAILYTILSMILLLLVLRSKQSTSNIRETVIRVHEELGPMTREQKRAMWLLVLTIVLLSTDNFHGISAGIVMMIIPGIACLPWVGLMDSKKLNKINFAPIFFIMGCMAIGSAGAHLKVTQWMAGLVIPLFQGTSTFMATLSAYASGAGANFILTILGAVSAITAPIAELGMQTGINPSLLYFSFQYGTDNLIFPYEYPIYVYFFTSGYINLKDMMLFMAIRMIFAGLFVAFIARPYWEFMLEQN